MMLAGCIQTPNSNLTSKTIANKYVFQFEGGAEVYYIVYSDKSYKEVNSCEYFEAYVGKVVSVIK